MSTFEKYDFDYWKTCTHATVPHTPSSFAEFSMNYMEKGQSVLDICSGNGRDSRYFKEQGLIVQGFDHDTLNLLEQKAKFGFKDIFDNVYCRFVLHAVPEFLEDYILLNSNKVLKVGGLLFIEARSNRGSRPDTSHYRRLIDFYELEDKLLRIGFEVIYCDETNGLSVCNNDDPVLIRLVAQKLENITTRGTLVLENDVYGPIHLMQSLYLLFTVKRILDDNKIPFFLVFGTLLGAYRDKGFISWDTDIDLGLLEQDRSKVMNLLNEGYFAIHGLLHIREYCKKSHLKAFAYKNDYIDLWFWKKEGKYYRSGKTYTLDISQIDKGFSKIMFYGQEFNTVHDIEKYLNRHYPKGWQEAKCNYHSKI